MKTLKQQKEFPVIPGLPEIDPGIDIPVPEIQPEIPTEPIPVEKPEENPIPEIEPPKKNI